jgi:hypothetical protein
VNSSKETMPHNTERTVVGAKFISCARISYGIYAMVPAKILQTITSIF